MHSGGERSFFTMHTCYCTVPWLDHFWLHKLGGESPILAFYTLYGTWTSELGYWHSRLSTLWPGASNRNSSCIFGSAWKPGLVSGHCTLSSTVLYTGRCLLTPPTSPTISPASSLVQTWLIPLVFILSGTLVRGIRLLVKRPRPQTINPVLSFIVTRLTKSPSVT